VLARLQRVQIRVQTNKHILRNLFGRGAVAEEAQRQAEHHRLLAAHDSGKVDRIGRFRTVCRKVHPGRYSHP
jgi:hypothetical protein